MELSEGSVLLNGNLVPVRRAHSIMFVQCTVLGKNYTMDIETDPVTITIDGYTPDKNDMKPAADNKSVKETNRAFNNAAQDQQRCIPCSNKNKK